MSVTLRGESKVRHSMNQRFHVVAAFVVVVFGALASYAANDIKSINGSLASAGGSGDFTFIVAGDNRPTAKGAPVPHVLGTIFSEIRVIRPDFVLWTGDVLYGYGDKPAEL